MSHKETLGLHVLPDDSERDRRPEIIEQLERALELARDPSERVDGAVIILSYRTEGFSWVTAGAAAATKLMGAMTRTQYLINQALDDEA